MGCEAKYIIAIPKNSETPSKKNHSTPFYKKLLQHPPPPPPFANCQNCNLGKNLVDKSTTLSNIGFSFTAGFSQFCSLTVKICLLGGLMSTLSLVTSMSGISLKLPNFLRL